VKKILSLLLLSAIFLSTIGYHFIFQAQQHQLKEQMKEALRKNADPLKVVEIRISLSDKNSIAELKWEDESEFILKGEMYDVIEKKKEGNELIIRCVKDKKETHLVNEYTRINKEDQNDPTSKNKSSILLKLIGSVFLKTEWPVIPNPFITGKKESLIHKDTICSVDKDIFIPPPQNA
jgi:hypothetical protein